MIGSITESTSKSKDANKFAAIIVCGGRGVRADSKIPKQYIPVAGKMIVEYTIERFLKILQIEKIILVISEENQNYARNIKNVDVVFGGKTRQQSVLNGINSISDEFTHILIHDGVRPFVSRNLILEVMNSLTEEVKAVIPGVPVVDTVKKVCDGKVDITISREDLYSIQTPQGFELNKIKELHRKYKGHNFSDDSLLFERQNSTVKIVDGEKQNYKITTKEDLKRAKRDLIYMKNSETSFRIGQGYDVHAFEEGDFVTICGIKIPHTQSLKGHSDADVGWHALTDAILGAIGAGDIGDHFSDKDPKWKGADSKQFLQYAKSLANDAGFKVENADITIICEEPKLFNFKTKMKENTAHALSIANNQINIAATTTEKLGFLGRKEGIAAQAVVMLNNK